MYNYISRGRPLRVFPTYEQSLWSTVDEWIDAVGPHGRELRKYPVRKHALPFSACSDTSEKKSISYDLGDVRQQLSYQHDEHGTMTVHRRNVSVYKIQCKCTALRGCFELEVEGVRSDLQNPRPYVIYGRGSSSDV